jgi:hypothetical protein
MDAAKAFGIALQVPADLVSNTKTNTTSISKPLYA